MSLYEDRDGDLWVGTFGGGLVRIERESGQLTAILMAATMPARSAVRARAPWPRICTATFGSARSAAVSTCSIGAPATSTTIAAMATIRAA